MTDNLNNIDASLTRIEEQLLVEYMGARHEQSDSPLVHIDLELRASLKVSAARLHSQLERSGEPGSLQLLTEHHEILHARIGVLRDLLSRSTLPAKFLIQAHDGIKARRLQLESRIASLRARSKATDDRPGYPSTLPPSSLEASVNRLNVTQHEERALQESGGYLDNGIYSASRELAMLANLIRGGTMDNLPDKSQLIGPGKASFQSRELSHTVASVDRAMPVKPAPQMYTAPEAGLTIAQTPEEVRRQLEAGGNQSKGPATFLARDIEPAAPQEFKRRRTAAPEGPPLAGIENEPSAARNKEPSAGRNEEPSAGFNKEPAEEKEPAASAPSSKAVFGGRDIEPEFPQEAPRPRKQKAPEPPPAKPVGGRASFLSRDLSDSSSPKKD